MALMHHNDLRVNSEVADDTVDIWRESGWKSGKHKDSDPDDDSDIPRVLPAADPEPEPEPAPVAKTADTKKKA